MSLLEPFIRAADNLVDFEASFNEINFRDHTIYSIDIQKEEIKTLWSEVRSTYNVCLAELKNPIKGAPEDIATVKGKYGNAYSTYLRCHSKINEINASLSLPDPNDSAIPVHEATSTNIRLPPCDTEVFKGDYQSWPTFRDLFTAVYIRNSRLSPVEKLFHLLQKTSSEAKEIVQKSPLTNDGFEQAWQNLKDRYENRRVLINSQLKILNNLTPVKTESGEKLKELQRTINNCRSVLIQQGIDISSWDVNFVFLCSSQLPVITLSMWEQSIDSKSEVVKWEVLDNFLTQRFQSLESIQDLKGSSSDAKKANVQDGKPKSQQSFHTNVSSTAAECKLCEGKHSIRTCPKFLELRISDRIATSRRLHLCTNCLAASHATKDCKSKHNCFRCKKRHNTLLHLEATETSKPSQAAGSAASNNSGPDQLSPPTTPLANSTQIQSSCHNFVVTHNQSCYFNHAKSVLLGTAMVEICVNGSAYLARALIDSGSEGTFISERLQKALKIPTFSLQANISGLNGVISAKSSKGCSFMLRSIVNDAFKIPVTALVVPGLTGNLPSFSFNPSLYERLPNFQLADPNFNKSSQVDILLGGDIYPLIIFEGIKRNFMGSLIAQETAFGWILTGPIPNASSQHPHSIVSYFNEISLSEQLAKFWEIEDLPASRRLSDADDFCEKLYAESTCRNSDGRYVVRLPFKSDFPNELSLGQSRGSAISQFIRLETKLGRQPHLKKDYDAVLSEYVDLKHMQPTNPLTQPNSPNKEYYLPHHAVVKEESVSTKLRVVFNASHPTSNGVSLNDVLHVGPSLQSDLTFLISKWRIFKYVFNADISKMYRQILVHPDHTSFQRIIFRTAPDTPLQDFELKTVTFGVNCAPYLAIRTLLQLASDVESNLPLAAHILRHFMYVDDVLAGGHEIQSTIQKTQQLVEALSQAGFDLRKWTSNSKEVLVNIPRTHLLHSDFLTLDEASQAKTLGIRWNAITDHFYFKVIPIEIEKCMTKRQILSAIAKLFDPVGWLAPIVIVAKVIMQQIWLEKTTWDEIVSEACLSQFRLFANNLSHIQNIQIPRWLHYTTSSTVQLHAFCDASNKAFATCIYLRTNNENQVHSSLLYAKTRVAPIKTISLPRLELSGALLLAETVAAIQDRLEVNINDIYCWTDSTIVLSWLKKPPCTWTTFVANRVSKITSLLKNSQWGHVRSEENPADLASRGTSPQILAESDIWWRGPNWMQQRPEDWLFALTIEPSTIIEMKPTKSVFTLAINPEDILERFSCLSRAYKVLCYVFRFYFKTRKTVKSNIRYESTVLTHREIRFVKNRLILLAQETNFQDDLQRLRDRRALSTKSHLLPLTPYLDNDSILRANGRLTSSRSLAYNESHPIILPYNCRFTKLLVQFIHQITLHGGNSLMLRLIRQEFWIPRIRNLVKAIIHQCKICVIERKKVQTQMMATLPPERCSLSRPFHVTGVDFAGPIEIKSFRGRGCRLSKGYVCLFVCFSTKAIHLEATSDLSTDTFLAAFHRFVSRRGCPAEIYSDNGTNFVGAAKILKSEYDTFIRSLSNAVTSKYLQNNISWKFIPPGAPHMGGLWEAGVKSFKLHFRKCAGLLKYTFEELQTLLARIEACLNSRPLSPQSSDSTDLAPLTPGHFLTGGPILSVPEPCILDSPLSLVNRWRKVKALNSHICERWKSEYLSELHKRYRWKFSMENLKVNDFVVIRQDNLPTTEWRLGRIMKVHRGKDHRVRIADIQTEKGVFTRPISKLVLLPPC